MVLLTMTQSMVDALESLGDYKLAKEPAEENALRPSHDNSLAAHPAVGIPISHGQVIDLWKRLQESQKPDCSLEKLLLGSYVYVPPPPPKPEPSDEYKALMARLRREEAERDYQRMINPRARLETLGSDDSRSVQAFAAANRPLAASDLGDDDVTFNEVRRQVTLIINLLVSVAGVAATLWVVARWWSMPARVLLSLAGAIVVAIAEVGVYQIYVYRADHAKSKKKKATEVKQVIKTWVVGQDESNGQDSAVLVESSSDTVGETVRRRRPPAAAEVAEE